MSSEILWTKSHNCFSSTMKKMNCLIFTVKYLISLSWPILIGGSCNEWIMTVFIEKPLAFPGSANDWVLIFLRNLSNADTTKWVELRGWNFDIFLKICSEYPKSKRIWKLHDWYKYSGNVKWGIANGRILPSGGISPRVVYYQRGYTFLFFMKKVQIF